MSANYILLTEINVLPEKIDEVIRSWGELFGENINYELFLSYQDKQNSILMVTNLQNSPGAFIEILEKEKTIEKKFDIALTSDWRHELLKFEESVIPLDNDLPGSNFLQLRHIEVPLRLYPQYLKWREDTIFKYVKSQKEIDFFLSYHSIISTAPGVMFLSGFSCAPDTYLSLFNNPEYSQIVKEAGDKFIAGGARGLYTTLYKKFKNQ